ncbi:MAG: DUF4276 family protein [Microscillaceae bacterium]|jgi:hypothetical protein|nr:DUF4276 family protein [Microscillaceae bacterium]
MSLKKIIIFVEGQSELIFVRQIILQIFNLEHISFDCFALDSKDYQQVPYPYPNKNAKIHFEIVNVGNDEKVLAEIKRRETDLFSKGFFSIIGLRDLYSEKYDQKSGGKIDLDITSKFIEVAQEQVNEMSNPNQIHFHFAIMEFEAWLLAMYENFEKINTILTNEFIKNNLGYDLSAIDPQEEFFKPANEIRKIFKLINEDYKKNQSDAEKLTSKLDVLDFEKLVERNVCWSFRDFYEKLKDLDS